MMRWAGIFGLLLSWTCWAGGASQPLILLTDCGNEMDDQWVVAHLTLSPEFDLRAIVTTHAGKRSVLPAPAAESSARSAREVISQLRLQHPPDVLAGSSVPLSARNPRSNAGVTRLLQEAKGFDRDKRLRVLSIGAATDLASALLLDASLADRIDVVAMGFASWEEGGKEFNIENDPTAWQVVLDSRVPVTIGDGAVCKRDLRMTPERAQRDFGQRGSSGQYLVAALENWLTRSPKIAREVTGNERTWPVWDEVTVACLLGETRQDERKRPRMKDDLTFAYGGNAGTVRWVTAVDSQRLWADLARKLPR